MTKQDWETLLLALINLGLEVVHIDKRKYNITVHIPNPKKQP